MSLIPLGVLAASAAPVAAGAYDLLESVVLTSDAASVSFTGLSSYASTYKHLQVRMVVRNSGSTSNMPGTFMQFNSVTSNSYAWHWLFGSGSGSPSSQAVPSTDKMIAGRHTGGGLATDAFGASVVDILDPFITTKNTTIRSLSGLATSLNHIHLASGVYLSTDAITSISLLPEGLNFRSNSRFSLYGVK